MTDIHLPLSWPLFPFLCLATSDRRVGVLYIPTKDRTNGKVKPVVYLVNMLDIKEKYGTEANFMECCEHEEFKTFEELLAVWRID